MRIISNYRDYYDSVQYWNDGDERIWIRQNKDTTYTTIDPYSQYGQHMLDHWILVGFCGKLYPAKVVQIPAKSSRKEPYYIPEYDDFDFDYDPSKDKPHKIYGEWGKADKVNAWNEFQKHPMLLNHFYEARVPIFAVRFNDSKRYQGNFDYTNPKIAVDIDYQPDLGYMGFYRLFSSYTAYQEIDMFLNNQLATCDDPDQITDNIVLRDSKGFDKRSFKKAPTKKR